MTAAIIPFDPLLARTEPRITPGTARRLIRSRRLIERHNHDVALERQIAGWQPGPNALKQLGRINLGREITGEHQAHVRVHPSAKPQQPALPLYDQGLDRASRIPEGLQWPLALLVQNIEEPGSVGAAALLAAVAAVREFAAPVVVPPVVGSGNDPAGMPRSGVGE